jgi:hypothetical protein
MGEGRWVEVRVVDGVEVDEKRCVKAFQQLRKELAEEGLPTQDTAAKGIGVALVGGAAAVSTVVAVLRDWIRRRRNPGKITVSLGERSIELERGTFDERVGELEEFLSTH